MWSIRDKTANLWWSVHGLAWERASWVNAWMDGPSYRHAAVTRKQPQLHSTYTVCCTNGFIYKTQLKYINSIFSWSCKDVKKWLSLHPPPPTGRYWIDLVDQIRNNQQTAIYSNKQTFRNEKITVIKGLIWPIFTLNETGSSLILPTSPLPLIWLLILIYSKK